MYMRVVLTPPPPPEHTPFYAQLYSLDSIDQSCSFKWKSKRLVILSVFITTLVRLGNHYIFRFFVQSWEITLNFLSFYLSALVSYDPTRRFSWLVSWTSPWMRTWKKKGDISDRCCLYLKSSNCTFVMFYRKKMKGVALDRK